MVVIIHGRGKGDWSPGPKLKRYRYIDPDFWPRAYATGITPQKPRQAHMWWQYLWYWMFEVRFKKFRDSLLEIFWNLNFVGNLWKSRFPNLVCGSGGVGTVAELGRWWKWDSTKKATLKPNHFLICNLPKTAFQVTNEFCRSSQYNAVRTKLIIVKRPKNRESHVIWKLCLHYQDFSY